MYFGRRVSIFWGSAAREKTRESGGYECRRAEPGNSLHSRAACRGWPARAVRVLRQSTKYNLGSL